MTAYRDRLNAGEHAPPTPAVDEREPPKTSKKQTDDDVQKPATRRTPKRRARVNT